MNCMQLKPKILCFCETTVKVKACKALVFISLVCTTTIFRFAEKIITLEQFSRNELDVLSHITHEHIVSKFYEKCFR